jgi:hypothetical protein
MQSRAPPVRLTTFDFDVTRNFTPQTKAAPKQTTATLHLRTRSLAHLQLGLDISVDVAEAARASFDGRRSELQSPSKSPPPRQTTKNLSPSPGKSAIDSVEAMSRKLLGIDKDNGLKTPLTKNMQATKLERVEQNKIAIAKEQHRKFNTLNDINKGKGRVQ